MHTPVAPRNNDQVRLAYYQDALEPLRPRKVLPRDHTMRLAPFKKYIGRDHPVGYSIRCKKFGDNQKALLASAFQNGTTVRILGAYREDRELLAHILDCKIDEATLASYERPKDFNRHRQLMLEVQRNDADRSRELWVLVFPSANYVDQVAELIQAIFDDFQKSKLESRCPPEVWTHHFPLLERALTEWTSFKAGIARRIRYGDVVAIGNIDQFEKGLEEFGFKSRPPGWEYFGIDDMFASQVRIESSSERTRRIVLIGFTESFWGQASALYVAELLNCGARHVLYGSKAATLIGFDGIGKAFAPEGFFTIESGELRQDAYHDWPAMASILEPIGVEVSGLSITVPTVIGEDKAQRQLYGGRNPACMDCESGFIARVVDQHNRNAEGLFGQSFTRDAHYIPVHFITDYIYRNDEKANPRARNLNVHNDQKYLKERKESFSKIGRCFGSYAIRFGLRDDLRLQDAFVISRKKYDDTLAQELIRNMRGFIEAGQGHKVVARLLALYSKREIPLEELIAVSFAAQKCGFTELFDAIYRQLKEPEIFSRLPDRDVVTLEILLLKTCTQLGDYISAQKQIGLLSARPNLNELLKKAGQYGAYYRRLGIVQAALGNAVASKEAFDRSEDEKNNEYQKLTTNFFRKIAELHGKAPHSSLNDISSELSGMRQKYNCLEPEGGPWIQSHLQKCAIAGLYLEGAFYLERGSSIDAEWGIRALFLAQMQNVSFGGNESSETYGEILNACTSTQTKGIVAQSMRKDVDMLKRFESFVRDRSAHVEQITLEGLALQRCAPIDREQLIGKLLAKR